MSERADYMDIVFVDSQAEQKLKAELRKEIIKEIRQTCGDCPKLHKIERERYKRVPRKVRGVYRG